MSTKDNSSIVSTSSFLKRLTRKRSSGPASPLHSPKMSSVQADLPPWIPPLVALGQDPDACPPPVASPPASPLAKSPSRTSYAGRKHESPPPLLTLPSFITSPVDSTSTTSPPSRGPQLPPVASIDTSLNLDMLKKGFLMVPEEHPAEPAVAPPAAHDTAIREPVKSAVSEKPTEVAETSAEPAAKGQRRSRTLLSLFRRKTGDPPSDPTPADHGGDATETNGAATPGQPEAKAHPSSADGLKAQAGAKSAGVPAPSHGNGASPAKAINHPQAQPITSARPSAAASSPGMEEGAAGGDAKASAATLTPAPTAAPPAEGAGGPIPQAVAADGALSMQLGS